MNCSRHTKSVLHASFLSVYFFSPAIFDHAGPRLTGCISKCFS